MSSKQAKSPLRKDTNSSVSIHVDMRPQKSFKDYISKVEGTKTTQYSNFMSRDPNEQSFPSINP